MYLWLKALHLFFMVSWFAGIFYLPRLFVHHALSEDDATCERLSIMEKKLFNFITPLAFLTLIFGLWLIWLNPEYYLKSGWFHAKLLLVVLLFVYHFYCGHLVNVFRNKQNQRSHVFYRIFNELPVLVLLAIIILAVVKPF